MPVADYFFTIVVSIIHVAGSNISPPLIKDAVKRGLRRKEEHAVDFSTAKSSIKNQNQKGGAGDGSLGIGNV
ncbi:MAG TPA: hypothetical protein VK149_09550 [Sideroxyarcus sp.]|nr:hypothetical protein [Sideroxyarcus sp.]